jgi:hypothetical protein
MGRKSMSESISHNRIGLHACHRDSVNISPPSPPPQFWALSIVVSPKCVLNKWQVMDNVHNCDSYIDISLLQIYIRINLLDS